MRKVVYSLYAVIRDKWGNDQEYPESQAEVKKILKENKDWHLECWECAEVLPDGNIDTPFQGKTEAEALRKFKNNYNNYKFERQ